ncbi:hypothetical protein [Leptolyngbya sp. GGD]|uniref:hypothetical protein n=1 Tax=Leptolyngbya sp. GGD TaxID=2997907 RepID=UPI00227A7498|nr:hypothetical protein [Leptolyngbya sp. GGD]MCY6492139.1 hypothetical protein [Leptolyngbya sp. GGD]
MKLLIVVASKTQVISEFPGEKEKGSGSADRSLGHAEINLFISSRIHPAEVAGFFVRGRARALPASNLFRD